jgi:osmotically inducible lipoprotein OsmB
MRKCWNRVRTNWKQILGSLIAALALWATAVALSGCSGQPLSAREKGTLAGGAIGAGTGAIIGSAVGVPGAGAAIGGALGAGAGMLVGNELENNETAQAQNQTQLSNEQSQLNAQRQEIDRLKQQQQSE